MILFENARFLALEKPSGVSMATRPGEEVAAVERLVSGAGVSEELGSSLRLVHRLDVGTSGVVLLARDPEAHREASRLFQGGKTVKVYRAVVWGHPRPARGRIDEPLSVDRSDRRRMAVSPGGKSAVTEYETLERPASVAHLEMRPRTGRTHQIRVHLASRGHPIVGDDLYGGPRWRGVRDAALRSALRDTARLLLHAHRLELPDPFSDGEIRIESPEPEEFARVLETARLAR